MKKKTGFFVLVLAAIAVFGSCAASPIKGEWGYEEKGLIVEAFSFENGKYTQSTFALVTYLTVRGTYTESNGKVELKPAEYFDYKKNKWDDVKNSGMTPTTSFSYTVVDKDTLSLEGTLLSEKKPYEYKRGSYLSRIEKFLKEGK